VRVWGSLWTRKGWITTRKSWSRAERNSCAADKAANSYTKEFLFGQTHNDRSLLQLVDDALERIRDEEFGECASCHQELQQKRLEAVPWTRYCITCQEKMEQGLLNP
jgi:DnaK suppressor protein